MGSILSKFTSLFMIFGFLALVACAGAVSPGGSPGAPSPANSLDQVSANQAAPQQSAGIPTTKVDPPVQPGIQYWVDFGPNAIAPNEQGLVLQGILEKADPQAHDFGGFNLRVIDRRNKKFVELPLVPKQAGSEKVAFSTLMKVPVFTSQELLAGETLSFYLHPKEDDLGLVGTSGEMIFCETPVCAESEWPQVANKKVSSPEEEGGSAPEPAPAGGNGGGSFPGKPQNPGNAPEEIKKPGS